MTALAQPLRLRPYRRLVGAYGINTLGTWLGEIALTILVLRETGSAAAVAAFLIAGQLVPSLIAPLLVARVDRLPTGRLVPGLLVAEALIFAVIALTASSFSLALVLSLAALDSVLGLTARALLKASAVAVTQPKGLLREGNSILVGMLTVCAALGPLVAGVTIAAFSVEAALLADVASFALAALVLGVRADLPPAAAADGDQHEPHRLRAAFAHVRARPGLRQLLGVFGVVALFGAAVIPVEAVLVTHTLGESEAAYGVVLAAWGGGAVLGSALLGVLRGASLPRLAAGAFAVMAVSYIGMGTATTIETLILFSALGGVANGIETFALITAIQEATAEAFQARVSGLVEALAGATMGAGFFLGGAIASAGSARAVYVIGGLGVLAAAGMLLVRPRRVTGRLVPALHPQQP